jgi:hypothetical protein
MNNFDYFTNLESLNKNYSNLIPEPQLLEKKENENEKFNEQKLKDKNTPKKIENIINLPNYLKNKQVVLLLKPARKPTNCYMTTFPKKIFCSPYKYDIYIKINEETDENYEIKFNFIDSEEGTKILLNSKQKDSITYGKTKKNKTSCFVEYNYRVCFTVCSFHHFKRAFIFTAELKKKDGNEIFEFFKSNPFTTFARKNENDIDVWNEENEEELIEKEGKKRKTKNENEDKFKKIKNEFSNINIEDISEMMNNNNKNQIDSVMQDFDFLLN